jgi:catechol 2,3-dioxygenase-like lactoylglutathione lyase family enzyme
MEPPTMNVLKPHVSLNVTDIDASVAFYEKVFDVQATKRRPGYAKFDLRAPSLNLSMSEAPRSGVNASHFGIQVATSEDVGVAAARFKRNGLETRAEENTACCYAVQDKVWVEDPDGNMWEVFVVKGDSPSLRTDQTICCAPTASAPEAKLVPIGAKRACC